MELWKLASVDCCGKELNGSRSIILHTHSSSRIHLRRTDDRGATRKLDMQKQLRLTGLDAMCCVPMSPTHAFSASGRAGTHTHECNHSHNDGRKQQRALTLLVTEDGRDPWPMPEPGWPGGCSIVRPPAPPTADASGAPPHPPLLVATPLPVPLGDAEAGAPTATPVSAATVAQDLARDA